MNARSIRIALTLSCAASAAPLPSAAQETMIAGWDFSQYVSDGLLSIDGATFTTILSANYSNLDPTFGAGAESTLFGTLYMNGEFGSTAVGADGSGSEAILPTAIGSLESNLDAPAQIPGAVSFDAFTVLQDEGQYAFNLLSMTAQSSASMVFVAIAGLGRSGNWILSFGGKTPSGSSMVGIDYSTDGSGYQSVGSVDLTTSDTQYIVDLGAVSNAAFVRMNFNPVGNDWPIIDNVALSVPEPGAALSAAAAIAALLACARRTRA